jgi:hypothetical protein
MDYRTHHTTPVASHLQAAQDRHNELVDLHNGCLDEGADGLNSELEKEFIDMLKALGVDDDKKDEATLEDVANV